MANREAFIDFVHGLLNINPLERWTPQQARTHPFITQQKFTGPFQPQMSLKTSTSRSPAPGVQQQQQAEALSRQRAQQEQQQQVAAQQAAASAYGNVHMSPGYPTSPAHATPQGHQQVQQQQAAMYQNMYSPSHQGAPPPYPSNPPSAYGQQMPMIQPPQPAASMHPYGSQAQPNLYAQATTRAGRQRASTMDGNGIPPALQRVVSHLDPNAPIRLQPSPAYYPPPAEGQEATNIGGRRRTSRAARQPQDNRNFVRVLEDRTLEEGWNQGGNGWSGA
jgi:dual specificity protein kinase YAK1